MFEVSGATGAHYEVLTTLEADWWNRAKLQYMDQFKFDNISDLQDLDRLLEKELLSYRWGNWLARDGDYDGRQIDFDEVRKGKENLDKEIRLSKDKLGIMRANRLAEESESLSDYIINLKRRAAEFGIHRDLQVEHIFNLFQDLKSLIGLNDRTDEQEQAELGVSKEDIWNWLTSEAIPTVDQLDADFRKNQKMWIREIG